MLTFHLPSGGDEHLLGVGLGDTEGTAVSRMEPAPRGQLVNGEHGMQALSPGSDALMAWVALTGGTLIGALGVGERCGQRQVGPEGPGQLNGISELDSFRKTWEVAVTRGLKGSDVD